MDPQANLVEQEELVLRLRKTTNSPAQITSARRRLKELRTALVDWLKGGGYEPDWSKCPAAKTYFDGFRRAS
jgi:hypothetical protein